MRRIEDVDWARWRPQQTTTLLFVLEPERILLIRKKRGLGAGKVNGPGGRLDPGETPEACAIRETQEELHITPRGLDERGELSFQFVSGLSVHVHVFVARAFEGTPTETEEASPLWVSLDAIPYDEMWVDDRFWLPLMLDGHRFEGRFLLDGDDMLDHALRML